MQRITVELPSKEAEQLADQLIERLDPQAKLRLAEKLERETRLARWNPLVTKMRRRFRRRPLSAREIQRLCETVREVRHQRVQGRR